VHNTSRTLWVHIQCLWPCALCRRMSCQCSKYSACNYSACAANAVRLSKKRHCGSEACSNSDLERSSGPCASFIEFSCPFFGKEKISCRRNPTSRRIVSADPAWQGNGVVRVWPTLIIFPFCLPSHLWCLGVGSSARRSEMPKSPKSPHRESSLVNFLVLIAL